MGRHSICRRPTIVRRSTVFYSTLDHATPDVADDLAQLTDLTFTSILVKIIPDGVIHVEVRELSPVVPAFRTFRIPDQRYVGPVEDVEKVACVAVG